MEKEWHIKKPGDNGVIEQLSAAINVNPHFANLLVQRGIKTYEEAKTFFRPSLQDLHNPFLMKDMNRAIDRITTAITKNERILIYGDYDVDGTTSVALLYSFFREFYTNLGYYIPDRYSEGYGISLRGIDYAKENNYSLIIALDCGIKAVEEVKYASRKKIDFIVCDHHLPGDTIPEAVAILDPKQPGCDYPYKELSGCGVGFKLIEGYARINDVPFENLIPYLDLVAVSTASDIVPITGENRILVYHGLQQLNNNPRTGLRSIMHSAGLDNKKVTVEDVVFRIGPRINAAGRMKSGSKAVDLLVSEDSKDAVLISGEINNFNLERREEDQKITKEALSMISEDSMQVNRKSTVVYSKNWHKGVIGIVASRLIETYYRPTIVLTESNGFLTGSARSVEGFDLYQALEACSDLLETFGGHMYAAGLTLKKENFEAFSSRFEEIVDARITPEQMIPSIDIDDELDLDEITDKFADILNQMEPFGPGNMPPVFVTRHVRDAGTGRVVGNNGGHLKLDLTQDGKTIHPFPAIAFNQSHRYELIREGKFFDICYTITENEFRGTKTLQLNIKDIKVSP
ncbi:MAG: single-stranded-DNA-specific exonuclease RecJ [Bacteroidales bacterium]|nr:single-stranded-DNA-specific exonuclease RecJ [Bacteroidales bacterium]